MNTEIFTPEMFLIEAGRMLKSLIVFHRKLLYISVPACPRGTVFLTQNLPNLDELVV